jgi:5'-nucleotidase/UDP-sugar diphosphatase
MMRMIAIVLVMLTSLVALAGAAEEPAAEVKTALSSDNALVAECGIGDLVADALRSQAGADLALVNSSALRIPYTIEKGPVSDAGLKRALAYPTEKVAVAEIKGSAVIAALERGLSLLPKPNKGFLQVSGITVWYDPAQESGHRVSMVNAGEARLDPEHTYRVAMPNALAKGGLGFFRIFEGARVNVTQRTMTEVLVSYARATKVIDLDPAKERRYRDVNAK